MEKIMEVKSEFSTKEFTLDYDSAKDKYYLSCVAYGEWITKTFYGEYALEEYLRDTWNFSQKQIQELYNSVYKH
jgi:hypothetical protein